MPRYQVIKKVLLNGKQFGHPNENSLIMEIGDLVDYDPQLKEFYCKGITAKGDLSTLITKGFISQVSSSPIYETSNIGTIHASDILFDPVGGIQSTNIQDAIVETYAESLQAQFIQENLVVSSNGQTHFLLSQVPYSNQSVTLFVNTAAYINGIDFTVSNDLITWLNRSFTLTTADEVVAAYFIDIG